MDGKPLEQWTVAQLKAELKSHGLAITVSHETADLLITIVRSCLMATDHHEPASWGEEPPTQPTLPTMSPPQLCVLNRA